MGLGDRVLEWLVWLLAWSFRFRERRYHVGHVVQREGLLSIMQNLYLSRRRASDCLRHGGKFYPLV